MSEHVAGKHTPGWPCGGRIKCPACCAATLHAGDADTPARTKPTRATLLADLAATTAADAKVIWNRALNCGAA